MLTIDCVLLSATELMLGQKRPSLKLALYAAAMSPLQSLDRNGLQTRILASYVNTCLPDRETLYQHLRQARGNINRQHLNALYRVEEIASMDILDHFTRLPDSYTEQCQWRERLLSFLTGFGMGRKTVSFAALIYSPLTCQLVPIDRHVMHRLGYQTDAPPAKENAYLAIEARVAVERNEAGYAHVPLGIWHWYKWEEYRQTIGVSQATEGIESHKLLSCRDY